MKDIRKTGVSSPRAWFSGLHWLMIMVGLALFGAVAVFVDLKPQVDENFFFSPSDPPFQQSAKVDKIFPTSSQLLISIAGPISSAPYLTRLAQFTRQIQSIETVSNVESLTEGPKDFEDAEKSPFWRRLLISDNGRSSNVVVFASNHDPQLLISRIENDMAKFEAKGFSPQLAGAPYVAEMIRRNLRHDLHTFSLTSVLLFGAAMGLLFRSLKLMLGMVVTSTSAVLANLLLQSLLGQKIGILTANLGTIVFVIAMSHLVYMTFNWQTLAAKEHSIDLSSKAWRMTLPASFWSMICASLGFGSLLLVPAKPLRELGIGGLTGTVIALICSYLMYPAFLHWVDPEKTKKVAGTGESFLRDRKFAWVSLITVLGSAALCFGLMHLNTDPSLLDYFKKGKEPREGLEYVDRNGGSNPLTLIIASADGSKLDKKEQYEQMWDLEDALEEHEGVGTSVSLPVLMAEADRHKFAFLFSWNHLLNILNEPKYSRVASTFVTKDRTLAAFYLRMDEHGRTKPRVEVVNDLRETVRQHGFKVALVGGVYELQGALARLVAKSLVTGLFWLMAFFTVIAFIVGRSLRITAAMIFSLGLVPVCMLGGIGLLHVPVDIISAPATNVCIGMAIDSMVHLVFGVKRAQRDGKEGWQAWVTGREEQWRGVVYSDVVIASGFALFALSSFPPTQRFGLVVVAGTVIDILANLFLLPLLGGAEWKHQEKSAAFQTHAC
jgi:uncharacterized protein